MVAHLHLLPKDWFGEQESDIDSWQKDMDHDKENAIKLRREHGLENAGQTEPQNPGWGKEVGDMEQTESQVPGWSKEISGIVTTARDDETGTQNIIPSITNWIPNRGGGDGKRKKYKSFCGPVAQDNDSEKRKSKGNEGKNFAMKHGVENSGPLGVLLNDYKRKSNCYNIPTITNMDSHKKPKHATDNTTRYPNAAYHTACLTNGTEGVLPYGKDRIEGGNENERMCASERSNKDEKPGLVSRMIKPFLVGRRPVGAYVQNGITRGHTPSSLPQGGPLFVPEVSGSLLLLAANGPGNQNSQGNGME